MSENLPVESGVASENPKSGRGFAAMSKEKRREIGRKGGHASQEKGSDGKKIGGGYVFTPAQRVFGGMAGGLKTSADRNHMNEIGARGRERREANKKNRVFKDWQTLE